MPTALMDTLCYVRLPNEEAHPTTLDLRASHALLSACFSGHATPDAQLFSGWEWYRAAQARLQINHFRCAIPLPLHLAASHPDLLAGVSGVAAYALGSLFNHSCAPNVEVSWPHGNACAAFVAQTDVAAGEQLTVRYRNCVPLLCSLYCLQLV